jgi:hypothetical protein
MMVSGLGFAIRLWNGVTLAVLFLIVFVVLWAFLFGG